MNDDKDFSITAVFILTLVVFVLLQNTVFYEPPSCITVNIDPWESAFHLFLSAMIAFFLYLSMYEVWNTIMGNSK